MSKTEKKILVVLMVIAALAIYLTLYPHAPAKLIFSFNEDYNKMQFHRVDMLVNPNVTIDEDEVLTGMEKAKERAATLFDVVNEEKVDIFVSLPGNRIYDMYLGIGNLGIYNPPIKTIAIDGQSIGDLSSTIIHEYSHHLFHEYIDTLGVEAEQIPEWLVEGLALTFEYELMDHVLVKYGPLFNAIPFTQLETNNELNNHTIYLQGFYGTMYLLDKYGSSIVKELMEETAESSFREAWASLIEEPYEEFHQNFTIQQGAIRKIDSLLEQPEELIAYVESINGQYGTPNVYSPFLSVALMEAYLAMGEMDKVKETFDLYEPFINNPAEFVDLANLFREDNNNFSELLEEKGLKYAIKYGYDEDEYKSYLNSGR